MRRARNKIVGGFLQEYKFKKKFGKLYLICLEQEYAVNSMTISAVQIIDVRESPSIGSIVLRGFILSKILGVLGLIAGTLTSKKNVVYKVKIIFPNGKQGLAEIDEHIYNMLINELFDII